MTNSLSFSLFLISEIIHVSLELFSLSILQNRKINRVSLRIKNKQRCLKKSKLHANASNRFYQRIFSTTYPHCVISIFTRALYDDRTAQYVSDHDEKVGFRHATPHCIKTKEKMTFRNKLSIMSLKTFLEIFFRIGLTRELP